MDLAAASLTDDVEINAAIYDAGGPELLQIIRGARPDAESVLLIGHNPAMQELALALPAEGEHVASIRRKLPTAALVVFDLPIEDWSDLEPGTATLADYRTPKQVAG
jgi:phosphohistidine phosphatase